MKLKIFVGPKQDKVPLDLVLAAHAYGPNAEYIRTNGQGEDALDFYIAYYIGELVGSMGAHTSDACFHIISNDKGFDPLIVHLKAKGIFCHRSRCFEEIPFDGVLPPQVETNAAIRSSAVPARQKATSKIGPGSAERLHKIKQNLINRKAGKPKSLSALRGTIKSLFDHQLSDKELQSLIDQLVDDGVLSLSQNKVTYGKQPTKRVQAPQQRALTEPAFDPTDPVAAATAYGDFIRAKLKCDILSLDTRQQIYALLDARLCIIALDREPMSLRDLAFLIANAIANTVPGLSEMSVFKLLYSSLCRVRAFETEPATKPFHPFDQKIVGSNKGAFTWDDLFILNFVQLMALERSEWPVIDEALSAVFGVSVETIGRITRARFASPIRQAEPTGNHPSGPTVELNGSD